MPIMKRDANLFSNGRMERNLPCGQSKTSKLQKHFTIINFRKTVVFLNLKVTFLYVSVSVKS